VGLQQSDTEEDVVKKKVSLELGIEPETTGSRPSKLSVISPSFPGSHKLYRAISYIYMQIQKYVIWKIQLQFTKLWKPMILGICLMQIEKIYGREEDFFS